MKGIRFSSWPGIAVRRTASLPLAYARPSTSFLLLRCQDVDARDKPGHDEFRCRCLFYRLHFESNSELTVQSYAYHAYRSEVFRTSIRARQTAGRIA